MRGARAHGGLGHEPDIIIHRRFVSGFAVGVLGSRVVWFFRRRFRLADVRSRPKEVARMVAGNFVTYRVPMNQKVNSVTDEHDLSAFDAGKPQKIAQAPTAPASGTAGSAKSQPKSPMGGIQAPVFREAAPASPSSNIS